MIRRSELSNYNHIAQKKVTASYTVQPTDEVILVDATAGAVTITLPDAVGNANINLNVKKIDSSGNAVTVTGVNSQTIDGSSTVSLSSQYATLEVLSDGSVWQIKNVSAAGTFTGGTISGATTVNVSSATAFVVGPNGTTNPTLTVITNVASAATGISITGNAAASGVAIGVTSSGANEDLFLKSKGQGAIKIQPGTDGTATFQVLNAAGTTWIRGDSSNKRLRIGDANIPNNALDVVGVLNAAAATATPAGGSTAARILLGTTANLGIYYGSGAPTVSAAQGSVYIRSDGSSTSTRLYINTDGATTWTNVTTAA